MTYTPKDPSLPVFLAYDVCIFNPAVVYKHAMTIPLFGSDGVQMTSKFVFAGKVVRGWEVVLPTMQKGEQCRIVLKPEYAYGRAGRS